MPFITTSKSVYHSPTGALHWATWCIACLIRLIQAHPTVTNCALLFTLITPSEEVDLLWVCLRLTSRCQRSHSTSVEFYGSNTRQSPSVHSAAWPIFSITIQPGKKWICNNGKTGLSLEIWVNTHTSAPCCGPMTCACAPVTWEHRYAGNANATDSGRRWRGLQARGSQFRGWGGPHFTARWMFVQPGIIYERTPS